MKGTDIAPEGTVWVCGACGKRARSRYGFDEGRRSTALDAGWDESCMLNAILCWDRPLLPWQPVIPQPERTAPSRAEGSDSVGNALGAAQRAGEDEVIL